MLANVLLPICLIALLGYWAVRSGFIASGYIQPLSQFVMKVSLPAFLVQALASKNLAEIWHPAYFIGYGGGSLSAVCADILAVPEVFHPVDDPCQCLGHGRLHVQYRFYRYRDFDPAAGQPFRCLSLLNFNY